MNFFKTRNIFAIVCLLVVAHSALGVMIKMPIFVTYLSDTSTGKPKTVRLHIPVNLFTATKADLLEALRIEAGIPDTDGIVLISSEAGKAESILDTDEKIGWRALRVLQEDEEEQKGFLDQGTAAKFIANVGPMMQTLAVMVINPVTQKTKELFISFDAKKDTIRDIINRIKLETGLYEIKMYEREQKQPLDLNMKATKVLGMDLYVQ